MTPYASGFIFTDAEGRPFRRPDPLRLEASINEKIAWLRSVHAYNDAVTDCGSRAFADQFRRAVRG